MLVTVVTLVTIENVYHMIITSVEPHNGNCGDIHNFSIFDDSINFGKCGNLGNFHTTGSWRGYRSERYC